MFELTKSSGLHTALRAGVPAAAILGGLHSEGSGPPRKLPRLSDEEHLLTTNNRQVRVRGGNRPDRPAQNIETWVKESEVGRSSRRHFSESEDGQVFIRHPAFRTDIPSANGNSPWAGDNHPTYGPRLACQAIVNAHQERRLRWAVILEGSVLGNSVNHIELHQDIQSRLMDDTRTLVWIAVVVRTPQQQRLDEWARAWPFNNNVNNYELEMLPVELRLASTIQHPHPVNGIETGLSFTFPKRETDNL